MSGPALAADAALRLWWAAAAVMLGAGFVALALQQFDLRQIGESNVWVKPAKFGFSLALHFATLAAVAALLSPEGRAGPLLAVVAVLSVAAAVIEMVWIARQAGLGELSHFNVSTPFNAVMWRAMAVGAVLIIGAAGALGLMVMADAGWPHGAALKAGIALGLFGGTALTLFTAFSIGAAMSPHVGAIAPGAPRMPVTGWSLTAGDLRVSHFLATHMLQVVPLAALLADRWLAPGIALAAVWLIAAGWSALTLWAWVAARAGVPLGWPQA